jgi:hypothetical protein
MLLQAKSLLAASQKIDTSCASSAEAASTSSDSSFSLLQNNNNNNNDTAAAQYSVAPAVVDSATVYPSNTSDNTTNTNTNTTNNGTTRGGDKICFMTTPVLSSSTTNNFSSDDDVTPLYEVSLKGVQENDVLCGRSEVSHIGNKKYRRVIEGHRKAYQNAPSRRKKTELSFQIILRIRQGGGRFLKMDEDSGEWQELDDKQAKEKVSHALRSAKDPDRPRQRKPRVVKKHVPTAKEEMLYNLILRDQQELFRVMMKKEGCDVNDLVLR